MKTIAKYSITAFVSLGILCSPILLAGFEYNCEGAERFPVYYGSPFIFKSTSLATSLAYDYYLSGLMASWLTWFILLVLIGRVIRKITEASRNMLVSMVEKGMVGFVLLLALLSIRYTVQTSAGSTMQWQVDVRKEAKEWGMSCARECKFMSAKTDGTEPEYGLCTPMRRKHSR